MEPTGHEPIDESHLDRSTFGDSGLRLEILALFIEQTRALVDSLDPALSDAKWADTAHTLKGSARGVGAWRLGNCAQICETLVGESPYKAAQRNEARAALFEEAQQALACAERLRGL